MSIIKQLEKDITSAIKSLGYDKDIILEKTSRPDLGQFQINDAMNLAKIYHKNPRVIAEEIKNILEKDSRLTNINIAGPGFINISLADEFLINSVNEINNGIENNIDKKPYKKVVIDYGGANVAKSLHVGHLRSANIGEALKRLANLLGYEAIGDAHLGDYGRPLGLVIKEIKERYPDLEYFDENYDGDYSEVELPITNKDLEEIYPLASTKSKTDDDYLEDARIITTKFQDNEKGYYELWKRIVDISKEEIKKIYEKLNVSFEIWNGESDEMKYFDKLVSIYEDKKLLVESEGAKVINVATEEDTAPMPPLLLIKSNGSKSYDSTDLAAILERKENFNPDEIWYVVDERQSLHFKQVFRAARKAKLVNDDVVLEHIGFGTMNGADGKPFKTRDGGVMSLNELIDIINDATYNRITNSSISENEKKQIASEVAISALKYADLIPYRGTDYIFNPEKFSELEGKTGPYLLYSTIRMKSLLEKGTDLKQENYHIINNETDKSIILTLLDLPKVLTKSLDVKSLNDIADYLYTLTNKYNKFYAENKILTEENEKLRESWLVLTKQVYETNLLLLNILGLKVPKKI